MVCYYVTLSIVALLDGPLRFRTYLMIRRRIGDFCLQIYKDNILVTYLLNFLIYKIEFYGCHILLK